MKFEPYTLFGIVSFFIHNMQQNETDLYDRNLELQQGIIPIPFPHLRILYDIYADAV